MSLTKTPIAFIQAALEWPSISSTINPALAELRGHLVTLLARLPLVALALMAVLVAWILSRSLRKRRAVFVRLSDNQFVQDLFRTTASLLVLGLGFLIALELLDATAFVTALLGTAGVVGLAIGFAFRDLAENFIASILLAVRQPFSPNDHVEIDGDEGRIVRLTSRATILMTLDGNHLRIPNAAVFKARILNYSTNPTRRFRIDVGVDTGADLISARRTGLEALRQHSGVLDDPEPTARVATLGDSTVQMVYFGWVDQRVHDFAKVRGDAIRQVMVALDQADIEMPEPIYRLRIEHLGAQDSSQWQDLAQGEPSKAILDSVEPPEDEVHGSTTPPSRKTPASRKTTHARAADDDDDLRAGDELASAVARELAGSDENLLSSVAAVE